MSGLMNVRGVVVSLINKFISPYVDNLNANDLNLAIMAGDLTLHNLHLKKSAVEKYNLPVEVVEGHIGHLHITIPWFSLRTNPVHIQISDVFLLVKMRDTSQESVDPQEDERKDQEAKQEKLRNAESLDAAAAAGQGAAGQGDEAKQTWVGAFTQKLVDNVQISIENIHLRYEDNLSTPEHPFAAGVTLSSFKAVSADENWIEAFIQNSSEGVRKLASLDGLAFYFDTDASSIYQEGDRRGEMMKSFQSLIASKEVDVPHQYILKPVSGESRITMKKKLSKEVAKTDAQVFFDEIGFVLDDDQYRDALSMLDLFHFYTRTHMYHRYRPPDSEFSESPAKARWKFATKAILSEIHERNRKWTWQYFEERRDNRKQYVELYVKTLSGNTALGVEDASVLEKLEQDLSYEDIRFFRSVAKAQAKKDADLKKRLQHEKEKSQGQQKSSGWLGWVWGGSSTAGNDTAGDDDMTISEADKAQLNEIIDYDPSAASTSGSLPEDFLLMRVSATLKRGSLALRTDPHGAKRDLISLVFDSFAADVTQMPQSLDARISLGDFSVFDGTTLNTLHHKIVRVKEGAAIGNASVPGEEVEVDPFFTLRFERNPLDRRADTGVAIRMRHLEIVYHRGYVEAVMRFLTPPASQLESISALIDAAGETFDGIRRETRAGLEFALEHHKTIDLQVDMNAPIIIVPERVDTKECLHMILDAGHIGVNSSLADKAEIRDMQAKKGQALSDDEFHKLEGLMYDEFSLKLESTQLLIGYKLDACLDALHQQQESSALHIIERVGMTFVVQNAMLNLPNLTRFKVSGNLPSLHVNLSDVKYKSLMRIIDVAIPHSDEAATEVKTARPVLPNSKKTAFRSQPAIQEYVLDDDESIIEDRDVGDVVESIEPDKFYDAADATTEAQRQDLHQKTFEFRFAVGELQAELSRSTPQGIEKALAVARLTGFDLDFALRKFDMSVDLGLRKLELDMLDAAQRQSLIDTGDSQTENLMKVAYRKVQKESPEYMSVFDGADQSIAVDLTTFRIHAKPEPLLALYDFIMTTFVPNNADTTPDISPGDQTQLADAQNQQADNGDKIRIRVKLRSIELSLVNGQEQFATLKLSSADVALLLRGGTMRLSTTLGKLTFVDDTSTQTADPSFKQLLTIEGDELADFSYETFNPEDETTFPGYNSAVKLRTGSLVFTVMEGPLKNIMLFLSNLSRLKAVYDRASEAAMQRAAEVTRMHYDVIIKTPIVVLPQDGLGSQNRLVLRLGQVNAKNSFGRDENSPDSIVASLSGVNITTEGPLGILQILDRVDLSVNVDDYAASSNQPKTQKIHGESNDIHMSLTQQQYVLVMNLTKTLPRILKADDETLPTPARVPHPASSDVTGRDPSPSVAAEGANMDFAFRVPVVRLELYGNKATSKETLHEDSIAAFSINSSHIQYESKADGASEANVTVKSIAMSNTRPGNSIYRDLIPEGKRRGNQFTVQYTVSAQPEGAAQALVTIDSPQVVLAVDPLYALTEFALAPFKSEDSRQVPSSDNDDKPQDESTSKSTNESSLSYRVEVRHSTVLILASDTDPKAQAIEMSIKDVVVAQQAKMTLAVHELGMSFGRMDQPSERVRFLDDVDITVAMDTRGVAGNQSMILDVDITPVIFRASYTEIMLIVDVVNKAAALASAATSKPETAIGEGQDRQVALPINEQSAKPNQSRRKSVTNHPQVVVSKETLHTRIGGFQLVLIGDLQDLPLVHLSTKPFSLNVNDWSTDLHAKTAMSTTINYYNLMNSHWEPLMDPWEFALTVAKTTGTGDNGTMAVKFTSRQRLEMNMTAAFIELAITSATVWSQQHERVQHEGRGVDAPFVVRNRTGYTLLVWADSDKSLRSSGQGKSVQVRRLADNEAIPWRFQDHKRQRENLSSSSHNAFGVQFENMPWERVRNVSVDREGDQSYVLKPRVQEVLHRVVCDVKLKDNVKIVTFRSAFQVENMTHLPMELVLIDANNKQAAPVCKIPPGESYPLPIEAAYNNRFKLRPDRGFDYSWSSDTLSWQDLVRRPVRSIGCKHKSPEEAVFRFQAASLFDKKDPVVKRYPKLNLRLRAPIEVENLLPYNIRYRVYDKNTRSNTTNFLIRGGSSPIHTVQLDHLLLLSVEAQDSGFKQSEFAIINTDNPDDFRTENSLILHDKRDQKLTLKLHYITYPDAGGAMKVQIYSPYIILNKTGLPFSLAFKTWSGVQNKVAGQEAFATSHKQSHTTPFMFSFPTEERSNRLLLKVGNSAWSKPISVEGVGGDSEVTIPQDRGDAVHHVGFSYIEGLGKYKLSKVITIAPRFLLRNESKRTVKIRQFRTQNYLDIKPGERVPWHAFSNSAPTQFSFALDSGDVRWSAPINVADVGRNHVVVPTERGASKQLLRIDIRLEGSTVFLFVAEEEGTWPLRIRNETDFPFTFEQTEETAPNGPPQDRRLLPAEPRSTVDYAWDTPAAIGKRIRLVASNQERLVDIMEIGIQSPFKVSANTRQGSRRNRTFSLDVRAEGHSQVLVIMPYDEDNSVYRPKRPGGNLVRSDSVDSFNAMSFETVLAPEKPTLTLSVELEGLGISVVNRNLQELLYASIRGIKLSYSDYPHFYDASLDCKWIQIDNQLFGGLFPIILYPTIVPKDGKELEAHPTLQMSVAVLKDDKHGVTYIKYATLLLQAMTIELDEDFLFAVYEFSKFDNASWQEPIHDVLITQPDEIPDAQATPPGTNVYFEDLALQPMQLEISFMRTERVNVDDKSSSRNPVVFFFNALTMALGNVNAAPVRLNALIIHNARLTMPSLQERVILHYREQFVAQIYRVLGSADFLGNPVGLFNNVSSGVQDIFYEPIQGVVMHGHRDLGIGIARGASSFAKKTVFGITDSLTKVTGSVGKGLAAATLDSDYQSRRRMAQRRNKPKHALYGFTSGANSFATSVASGFEGLALKPIEGAESGGVGGFFKGVGKGFVGAVTKPVVGVFDFASNVTEGIRNTTTVFDQEELDRVRLPRFIGSDGILRPFTEREAFGQFWLKDLENGRYFKDTYVAHLDLPGDDSIIMLTGSRILLVRSNNFRVSWEVPFDDLQTISLEPNGISLVLMGDVDGPFIPVVGQREKSFLFKHIETVVKQHNEVRKAD